jgi:hypothetical protein
MGPKVEPWGTPDLTRTSAIKIAMKPANKTEKSYITDIMENNVVKSNAKTWLSTQN